ncbi:MAG: VWA domain-containing protein [Phycisphaerales bacterium]|nr:VWA domain-containing protein [Phycisphaerales bacterium]
MTWLTPGLAAAAAAIAVPTLIILYFLTLRRRSVDVSTTLLWKKAVQDLQANAPFQRLRRNILLLLQLVILAAALLAVAQPQTRSEQPPGAKTVIFFDRSASMATIDETDDAGRPISRLEKAKLAATRFVDGLREPTLFARTEADEAMIIAFDRNAEIVRPFTSNKGLLREAISRLTASDAGTSIDAAVRLANPYISPRPTAEQGMLPGAPIVLFSDGGIPSLDAVRIHPETEFRYVAVGKARTPNLAVTAIRAARAFDKPDEVSVFVGVQSSDPAPRTFDVQFEVDGVVAGTKGVDLPGAADESAPASTGVVFRLDRATSAVVAARIVAQDALPADNVARLVLPPAKRLAVALVTEGNFFIRLAIEGMPLSKFEQITPAEFQSRADSGSLDAFDVYVLDGFVPARREGRPALPPGRFLVLGAVPALRGITPTGEPEQRAAVITDYDRDHPILRLASLDNLIIGRQTPVRAASDVRVLASSTVGPAIIDAAQEATRAIVLTFSPADSNWPFDQGLLLFIFGAVRALGDDAADLTAATFQPGEVLTTKLPPGASAVRIARPDGVESPLEPAADGLVTYGPVASAGLYVVRWNGRAGPQDLDPDSGRPGRVLAVNIADPQESQLIARERVNIPRGEVRAANRDGAAPPAARRLWPYLLWGAILVLMLEWFVYNRKVQI